jgi:hypothetical protein
MYDELPCVKITEYPPLPRGEGIKGRVKESYMITPTLTLPPQWGGSYKVTLWQDHRELKLIKGFNKLNI